MKEPLPKINQTSQSLSNCHTQNHNSDSVPEFHSSGKNRNRVQHLGNCQCQTTHEYSCKKTEQNQKRVRVTFAQLEAEEYEEARAKKIEQQKKRELAKEISSKEISSKEKTELTKSRQGRTV